MTTEISAISKLLCLRPPSSTVAPEVRIELAKRFFETEAVWANKLGLLDHFPCVDIADAIKPGIDVPDLETFNSSGFAQSTAESKACRAYLRWSALRSTNANFAIEFGLDDPYEHLLSFFKNGGEFSIEHGWMADVAGCGGFDIKGLRRRAIASLSE